MDSTRLGKLVKVRASQEPGNDASHLQGKAVDMGSKKELTADTSGNTIDRAGIRWGWLCFYYEMRKLKLRDDMNHGMACMETPGSLT